VEKETPTSLYLAMQEYGLKKRPTPLIPGDFERQHLPPALKDHKGKKIFGLTIPGVSARSETNADPNSNTPPSKTAHGCEAEP
jgi:hypothetical protein